MITVLCMPKHRYTTAALASVPGLPLRSLGYHRALRARSLPAGTYVFTDLDRLNFWELELAARLYRTLRDAGMRVINDPARARDRYSLLRALKDRGFNRFDVWRADEARRPTPDQFPVFLRTQSAHRGNLTDLLETPDALEAAIVSALDQGVPARELMISQYCAEPIRPGLFRKLSVFRVGERLITTPAVHEGHWSAKYGQKGAADAALYEEDLHAVERNRYGEALREVFEVARIEYGRADFSVVDGRPQVYEINTNPMIGRRTPDHPSAIRVRACEHFFDRLCDAVRELDRPARGERIGIEDATLVAQRRHDRFLLRPRWTP